MTEELYIISVNMRHKVDLNTPSGITLSFESNLFTSLDSVNCNRTFTFSLPRTLNNERIFEALNDIRTESRLIGKKLKCEYRIDGCPIVSEGNLYVSSYNGTYQAVMTWDVIEGLQKIKDDNININELDEKEGVETGTVIPIMDFVQATQESFDNYESVLTPFYGAGVPAVSPKTGIRKTAVMYDDYYALPVVPVPYIIRRIESYYGIRLDMYRHCSYDIDGDFNVVDYGVIPLCSTKVTPQHEKDYWAKLTIPKPSAFGKIDDEYVLDLPSSTIYPDDFEDAHPFWFNGFEDHGGIFSSFNDYNHDGKHTLYGMKTSDTKHKYAIYGTIYAMFQYRDLNHEEGEAERSGNVIPPTLTFWRNVVERRGRNGEIVYGKAESVGSVEGVKIMEILKGTDSRDKDKKTVRWYVYEFNLDPQLGGKQITVEGKEIQEQLLFCSFDVWGEFYSDDEHVNELQVQQFYEEGDYPHETDIISNLPEVSCLDFVKSLFYMKGGYPVMKNGHIEIASYESILEKIPYAYDWTDRVIVDENNVSQTEFKVGDFGKRNWYLTNSDDVDKILNRVQYTSPLDDAEDKYADGYSCIETSNENINDDKTIVKVPWNAPFILNGDNPRLSTGNTLKYWTLKYGDKSLSASEAKPCYGIIDFDEVYVYPSERNQDRAELVPYLSMKAWEGFNKDAYRVVDKMLEKPIVITKRLDLSIFDLVDLDMARPVYLGQLNSYFCIIKIQRETNGICTATLAKIPTELLN